MNILVCISHVPDTTTKIKFTDGNSALDTSGVKFTINPYDEFVLTKAIHLQKELSAKVSTLTVGGPEVEPTLRKTLAIGADEAFRIDTSAKDGQDVATQIAAFLDNNSFDVIFTGTESIDYNESITPALLAAKIGFDFINYCVGLDIKDGKAHGRMEMDGGHQKITTNLPVVVAGQKGIVEESDLIIPNMRGIMSARKKPLSVVSPIETDVFVEIVGFEYPPSRSEVKMIDKDNIQELVDIIKSEIK